jgi:thiol-disulfide isomerase/thioredoxin
MLFTFMRSLLVFLLLSITMVAFAQSRRVAPATVLKAADTPAEKPPDQSVKQMFDEVNVYYKTKLTEFEQQKIPYSESLDHRTRLEQRQLAAKYAGIVSQRGDLAGEDIYYLGMLHWIAENLDGTSDTLKKYLSSENPAPDKVQTSRSLIVVIAAKRKGFADAESLLQEYIKASPTKLSERARMESELAKAYLSIKNPGKAWPHADEAYRSMKTIASDPASRAKNVDELLDDGMVLFEAYRDSGKRDKADETLEDMRTVGVAISSPTFYYYSVDNLIKYMIETGRKPLALDTYTLALDRATKDFTAKEMQTEVIQRLKKREKQYKMLGEHAPELQSVNQWFPGQKTTFEEMRGKVIFLDFWATWCTPCLEAFPSIKEWYQDFSSDGLVILGVTRYYGIAEGFPVDNQNETGYFRRFKKTYDLPYDFVVTKDTATQREFGATTLPTAVLIDRKGIIRFIDSGTSPTRLEAIRENIVKLLAEK